jgi:predicted Fe-S protein YdhL (DUF1289 family)
MKGKTRKRTPLTAQEMQLRSAKARWGKLDKEQRSAVMRELRAKRRTETTKDTTE